MIKLKNLLKEQSQKILKKGMSGDAVKALQQKLIKLKFLEPKTVSGKDAADGIFGSGTKAAVVKFQKSAFPGQTKEHDGIAGYKTLTGLTALSTQTSEPDVDEEEPKELPFTQYRNEENANIIVTKLFKASRGVGTDEKALRYAIRQIKNKTTYDRVNIILKAYQKVAKKSPPNQQFRLGNNRPELNTDWSKDYGSIEDILNGEYGWFDAEDKQLSYNILNKIKDKGDAYGVDTDQNLNLGPIAWFKTKVSGKLRNLLFKIAPQVAQYLMPKTMTNVDFTDEDRKFLGNVINNAIKRGANPKYGAIGYEDYSPAIQKLLEGGMTEPTSWIKLLGGIVKNDESITGGVKGFQFATLLGRFTFKKKPDGKFKIEPDTYDFSKGISITNNVLIDELQGLTWPESIKYIMQKNTNLQGSKGVYQAIRHIGHVENPQGGTRPDGSELASISLDNIEVS